MASDQQSVLASLQQADYLARTLLILTSGLPV